MRHVSEEKARGRDVRQRRGGHGGVPRSLHWEPAGNRIRTRLPDYQIINSIHIPAVLFSDDGPTVGCEDQDRVNVI